MVAYTATQQDRSVAASPSPAAKMSGHLSRSASGPEAALSEAMSEAAATTATASSSAMRAARIAESRVAKTAL